MSGLVFHKPIEVDLSKVHFATYNPRVITSLEMKQLKASMLEHGVVLHLVLQKRSDSGVQLVLIAGHQRIRAARELCNEHGWPAPKKGFAVVLDIDDRTAKRLNISLNRLGGDFELHMLGQVLGSLGEMSEAEMLGIGFESTEIDEIVRQALDPEAIAAQLEQEAQDEIDGFARSVTLTVEFDTVERRDDVKARLKQLAKERSCKPGVLLSELLED